MGREVSMTQQHSRTQIHVLATGQESSRRHSRALKTNARLQWPLACDHAHKQETQTQKTQISSEVNYIALYFDNKLRHSLH